MSTLAARRRRLILSPSRVNVWKKVGGTARYWSSTGNAPTDVFISGALGTRKFSQAEVSNDMDWYWDESKMRVYVNSSEGDPDTVPVEIKVYCQ